MIEREFIRNKIKNLRIRKRIADVVGKGAGCGCIEVEKTPLGEKIIISTLRPGLVIGRGGETIKRLTAEMKAKYGLENPQIEVKEVLKPNLVAAIVARRIADEMERFGPQRVKSMGYRSLTAIMKDGAMGAEIIISGRGIPSQRSKTHRFYAGYLKKCGDIAVSKVDKAIERADLRSGAIGIIVKIMLPGTFVPDKIKISAPEINHEELKDIAEQSPAEPLAKAKGVPKELKEAVKEKSKKAEKKKAKPAKEIAKSPELLKAKPKAKKSKSKAKKKEVKK